MWRHVWRGMAYELQLLSEWRHIMLVFSCFQVLCYNTQQKFWQKSSKSCFYWDELSYSIMCVKLVCVSKFSIISQKLLFLTSFCLYLAGARALDQHDYWAHAHRLDISLKINSSMKRGTQEGSETSAQERLTRRNRLCLVHFCSNVMWKDILKTSKTYFPHLEWVSASQ